MEFWSTCSEAVLTSLSFFWMALWAFVLGYTVSASIQVFVTRERMRRTMGGDEGADLKSVGLGTFFGFISSSCSFSALATTKSLFQKGAGFVPSLAFLLASTNLVVELGIIIAIFLGWQCVVGEYIGGLLLIALTWLFVRLTRPDKLIRDVRERLSNEEDDGGDVSNWRDLATSVAGWRRVAKHYFMEWGMVWKDVTFGFTVAGIIAAFVPPSFFQTLFVGAGSNDLSFLEVLAQTLIGPIAAFFTFIGSMGNIPLAALLFNNGVSFAGVMAFIFSDLVVFPVLRVNAKYYGWRMSLYILAALFVALIGSALLLHYGFSLFGILPSSSAQITQTERFAFDYTFFLNLTFLALTGVFAWLALSEREEKHQHAEQSITERVLFWLALASYVWLAGGLVVSVFV